MYARIAMQNFQKGISKLNRLTMYKVELIIQTEQGKVDINNAIGYAFEKMKENGTIDNYSHMITAVEDL